MNINEIFIDSVNINGNYIELTDSSDYLNQKQTCDSFSLKWKDYDDNDNQEKERFYKFQEEWYLKLYGFKNENDLSNFLKTKSYILDAGCGLGYKSAWFAQLAPNSKIIGIDLSEAVQIAANKYKDINNLYFIKGDIADTKFRDNSIDYISCDQVLQHTEIPEKTFDELVRILNVNGEFSCYVYRKKALIRELVDDYFRVKCKDLSHDDLMEFSRQVAELGKILSDLKIEIDVPDIPQLGIKGGKQDLQRFIYWNFLKCYWNETLGENSSIMINYDWYSPSNAKRFTKNEFYEMINKNKLEVKHFHEEEACYSGRFLKI